MGAFGSADQKVEYTVSADGGATFTTPHARERRDEMLPFFFSNPSVAVDDARALDLRRVRARRTRRGVGPRDRGEQGRRQDVEADPDRRRRCAIHMVPNLALDPTHRHAARRLVRQRGRASPVRARDVRGGCGECTVQGCDQRRCRSRRCRRSATARSGSASTRRSSSTTKRRSSTPCGRSRSTEGDQVVTRIFHAPRSC